jgi:DNA-binding LacI/PurR family transcriptional regulator
MKRKTLRDVAQAAGVSTATVSRISSRSARVSPDVESRVRAAADKLGVRLERRNSSRLIAFLLGNRSLLHPFHSHVLVGAEAYCAEHDYTVLYFPWHYPSHVSWEKLHLPRILERPDVVDAFMISGVNSPNLLERLSRLGLPFSVYADTVQGEWKPDSFDTVWTDAVTGGYEMTRYLQSLGHKHIWFVANVNRTWFEPRYRGYCRAMQETGWAPVFSSVDSDNEQEVGFLATKQILRGSDPLQAILCGSDATCHGVYAALRDFGLKVPEDVSVAGFNDTIEATVLHPPLTTVRNFSEQVGRSLAELAIYRLGNPTSPTQNRIIPTQIIRRESCRLVIDQGARIQFVTGSFKSAP